MAELDLLEERHEPLFFHEQHGAEAVARTARPPPAAGILAADEAAAPTGPVIVHLRRPERDMHAGMRLDEATALIPGDAPVPRQFGVAADEVGEEVLGEVFQVERLARQLLDRVPG